MKKNRPKILLISTRDIIGGAAKAAFRLHQALLDMGMDSNMLVLEKGSDDQRVTAPASFKELILSKITPSLNGMLIKALYKRQIGRVFSSTFSPYSISRQIDAIKPDVINLHWVGDGFFPISTIKKFNRPIVWTLHDMWAFTGGCHYTMECENYLDHCGYCPAINSSKEKDMSYRQFDHKLKVYRQGDITVVTPSRWLGKCAQDSVLFSTKEVKVIPNNIDIHRFKPNDKIAARRVLNLPLEGKIVMFGAMNPKNPIKGHKFIAKALTHLPHDHKLVIFGTSRKQEVFERGHEVFYLGSLKDEISLIVAYTAADVVVVPSVYENLSNVILESLACGTPVAAFDIGGNSDIIIHKENGYLAQPYDTEELAYGINWITEQEERHHAISQRARESVMNKYQSQTIAEAYISLFCEKLNMHREISSTENEIS